MPNPACTVQDGGGAPVGTLGGVNVGAGDTITVQLVDLSASLWSIACISTDELSTPPALTVNSVAKNATFTAGVAGSAYIFQSKVNNGLDLNENPQPLYTTTFGVYVLSAIGLRVFAVNEETEGSAGYGWITKPNPLLRGTVSVAGGSTVVHRGNVGNGTAVTLTETTGRVAVGFNTFSAPTALKTAAAPQTGMEVYAYCEDNSYTATNCIVWTPQGSLNITRANVSASTFSQTPAVSGVNGEIGFRFDGVLWRAMS
jgi:hypothetical protein